MSFKVNFLHSYWDSSPRHLEKKSLHQDIVKVEKKYQVRWNIAIIGDFWWFLIRKGNILHKWKKFNNHLKSLHSTIISFNKCFIST